MARYRSVDPSQSFPKLEEQILERWRERDVFHESVRRRRGLPGVRLLRGAADGERPALLAPRPEPRLQGCLPPLQDDARPPGAPQGRLGLPRPAGRAPDRAQARLPPQGRHRALRRRRVQPAVPRVGARVHRRVGAADGADRLLGRHRRRVLHARRRLHRVSLVVAEAGLGEGPALRGPQGRAVLPALWHGPLEPRGRARATRTSRIRRSTSASRSRARRACRSSAGRRRRGRCSRTRRSPSTRMRRLRARPDGRRDADPGRGARRARARRGGGDRRPHDGRRPGRDARTSRRSRT